MDLRNSVLECAEQARAATGLGDLVEHRFVGGELVGTGRMHPERCRRTRPCTRLALLLGAAAAAAPVLTQLECTLASRHGEVDIREDLSVEQRAMKFTPRIVHAVALAERVKVVALPRMQFTRQRQGVLDVAEGIHRTELTRQAPHLGVEEPDIERRVVNDQFRAFDEGDELVCDLAEARLPFQP